MANHCPVGNPTAEPYENIISQYALTEREPQAIIGVSARTWSRMQAAGETPACVRISRRKFYLKSSVMRWLESREQQPRGRRRLPRRAQR